MGYGGFIPPQELISRMSGPIADGFNGGMFAPKEFNLMKSAIIDGGDRGFCSSAIVFDTHQELLWMGNQGVCWIAFYDFLTKFSKFLHMCC